MGVGLMGVSRRRILASGTWILALTAALTFLFTLTPSAEASPPGPVTLDAFQPGALLVKFKPLVFPALAGGVLSLQGYRTLSAFDEFGIRLVAVTPGQEIEALAGLRGNPLVEFAELDYVRRPLSAPNDPDYGPFQWNLQKIGIEAAWDISRGDRDITVAVIDTGLDMSHPDRPANIVSPFNECTGDSNVSDDDGHGTHVSGIIAANTNNGIGVAGVAPRVSLMPIRVECGGSIYVSTEVNALHYAADNGARVISISLGGNTSSLSEKNAINYALNKGSLVVAAAGNEYLEGNPLSYPASYPGVLAVAATTAGDTHSSYSQEHPYVSIAAPGGDGGGATQMVRSIYKGSSYIYMAGTSQATPHVSGLAGLVLSVNPGLSPLEVIGIITSTAVDLGTPGKDDVFGWGRIDALAALSKAQESLPVPSPTTTPAPTAAPTATSTATPAPPPAPLPSPTPGTQSPTATPIATTTVTPAPEPTPPPFPTPATSAPTATPVASPPPLPTPAPTGGGANQGAAPLTGRAYLPMVAKENSAW